jgi:8-oxo-dGTP pyrophosphatase MutT (NUDIX family)
MDLLELLKARLSTVSAKDLPPHPHRRAAVLIPVLEVGGVPHLLLTKRTETVEHHKGQISFPGGRHEELDPDLLTTALREAYEEIGLPPESVDVWGRLDEVETVVSGFAITPYLGFVRSPVSLRLSPDETEEIVTVPLAVFLDPANLRVEQVIRDGRPRDLLFYDYPPHTIWGVTARIIKELVDLITSEHPRGTGR